MKEELIRLFEEQVLPQNRTKISDNEGDFPVDDFGYWLIEHHEKEINQLITDKSDMLNHVRINNLELQSLRDKMDKAQKVWAVDCGDGAPPILHTEEQDSRILMQIFNINAEPKQVLLMEVEEK